MSFQLSGQASIGSTEISAVKGLRMVFSCFHGQTSPKGFLASRCDVGDWTFSKSQKYFEKLFRFFFDFLGIFKRTFLEEFLQGNFWEKFLGRIFQEDFLGGFFRRIFWEDFLGRIFWEDFLGGILWEELFSRN